MKSTERPPETPPAAPTNAISEDRMLALARRFAELTAAQRTLFLQRLEGENIDFNLLPIPSRHAPHKADAAEGALPASYAQVRLWFLWRLEPDNPTYNLAGRLRLTGEINHAALAASVNALVARHESLRTTFSAGPDGAALQKVHPPAPLIITWRDCRAMSAAQLSSVAEAEGLRPFDLGSGPLLRVMLMRCSTDQHLLLLTAHHIVSDGWSSGVLLRELAEGYRQSASAGSDADEDWTSRAPLPIQYPDFALWQRRWLEAGEAERQRCWWQKTLGGTHPALNLPTDRSRPSTLSGQGARHTFNVSAGLTERLRAMAREQGVTLFMVLLASFKALLYRYSGQGDIRVGVPVAGRHRAETEALIGFFINTLVVRTCPHGQQAFSALLSELKEALLGAEAHQDLPFEQLVEALQEGRSASHHPLFQVMANHQKRGATPQWSGLIVEEVSEGNPVAKFDLTLSTEERADGMLFGAFVYASELFDAATIVRLTAHFLALLEQVAHSADLALDQLVLLSPVERARISHWNVAAGMPLAPFVPIHVALAAQWQACDIALIQGERTLSWGEFELRANRLAHALIASGVGAEVRVGISIERSPEMIIGLLAILKSGGTFVPLDPGYPAERLAFMVADAGVQRLVTQRELAGRLPELTTLYVDDDRADLSDLAPDVVIHPAQSAYLIYTSGSTGQPKGVTVEHGPLARHCQAIGERYRMRATDRVLHFASINFDLAHEYWLMPLLFGARLIITDPVLWSPVQTCNQMARHGVTVAAFPPSYLVQLAEAAQACPVKLRVLAFGGEALSCEHFDMVRRVFAPATLINGYGPTETVISPMLWITDADTDPAQWQDNAYLPIGTPVGARSVYVLDAALNALPLGVAGELYVGGPLLARGYHARAAMTAERFIPDPFSAGGRLYRTGDRARWRADGSVDYLGRLDHQVKLRGLRIEPGEIEAQLLACAGVREAAVLVQGEGADAQLVAYLVADGVDLLLLKQQLGQRLPHYMVPSQWLVLAQMPVTANGKLDRRALPVPTSEGQGDEVYRAPQSSTEITLAAIWAEVLKLERVGLDDHFFALGGHSLLATQICARIGSRMDLVVPLGMLFQTPVLGEFAARVVGEGRRAELIPIPRRTATTRAPLSFAQQGLWLLWQLDPADCGWNIASARRWRGAFDVTALQAAFDALVTRHAALRTSFPCGDDGVAMQLIDAAASVAIDIVALSRWPHAEREAVALMLGEAEAMQPFNLETGPLLRVRLIQIAPDDHVLLLTMHHIVADGWSCGLIFDELMAVYRGHQQGAMVALPVLGITYADYAHWQRGSALHHVTDTAERAYWRAQLNDAAALILPAPDDAPRLPGMRGEQLLFALEAGLVSRARSLAQDCGATLSMLLQAAFHALLYRHTGQADHCIGILSANRDRVETEALVGLFLNPQVLRARIDPGLDFMALIKAVRETLLGAQAHAGLSFGAVVEELRPQRKLGRNPLFQVLYNFMRPDRESFTGLPGIHIDAFFVPRRKVVFDLEFDVAEDQNGAVRGAFSYAVDRVDADFAQGLRDDYPRLLAALVAASDSALAVTSGPMRLAAKIQYIPDTNLPAPALMSLHPQWEATMTQLWMRVLGVTVIGRHDNFFALGGSSLLALAVVAGARRQGMALGVADLFLHQTITELAAEFAAVFAVEKGMSSC